jgi:tRNA(fMet)-specific endonuclease VapC
MYLLDTNHCSRAILGDAKILDHLQTIEQDLIFTCAIVQGELVDMAERSQRSTANLILVQNFLQGIYIYFIFTMSSKQLLLCMVKSENKFSAL